MKMKNLLKYLSSIALMYLAVQLETYLSDMYWSMSFGLWDSTLLPIVVQTSLFILVRIALIIAMGRYLIQRKFLTSSPPYFSEWETQTVSQWLPSLLLLAIMMIFASGIFTDFITLIGLMFSPKIFGV